MARYLVTGGAGFIGSHISEALVNDGHEVTILDNFSSGKRENFQGFVDKITVIEGDIRDASVVGEAMRGMDFVFHEAALASVPRSIDDPTSSNQVNAQGTLNILEAAKDNGVKKVVYASSSSLYGDSDVLPKVEDMPPQPKSPYAISKLAGEYYCRVFSELFDLPTVSLRYFNVFGPRQDPDSQYAPVIPLFVKALLEGKPPTIYGDGEQSRDFTYIDNVVLANLQVCHDTMRGGRFYNVACGERFSLNFLYERLKNIIGSGVEPVYTDPRLGDVKHSQASIEVIQGDVGYRPTVDFEEGLARTVRWYQDVGLAMG